MLPVYTLTTMPVKSMRKNNRQPTSPISHSYLNSLCNTIGILKLSSIYLKWSNVNVCFLERISAGTKIKKLINYLNLGCSCFIVIFRAFSSLSDNMTEIRLSYDLMGEMSFLSKKTRLIFLITAGKNKILFFLPA